MKKLLLLAFVPVLGGCAVVTPRPTSMIFSPQGMEVVGRVSGESRNTRLLCVIPVSGEPASLQAATENAVKPVRADTIINPSVDDERGIGFLGLWCWQKITVSGIAIRFKRGVVPMAQTSEAAPAPAAVPAGGAQRAAQRTETPQAGPEADTISEMEKRLTGGK
jgi:hypothetical protein